MDLNDAILAKFWGLSLEQVDEAPDYGRLARARELWIMWKNNQADAGDEEEEGDS